MLNWLIDNVFDRARTKQIQEEIERFDYLSAEVDRLKDHPMVKDIDLETMALRHPVMAAMYPDMFKR